MKIPSKINNEEIKNELQNNSNRSQNNSLQNRANISHEELVLYSRQKIIKDIEFAKKTIPYIRNYIYFVGFSVCICSFVWSRYYKNSNISFSKMLLLNIADLEKE